MPQPGHWQYPPSKRRGRPAHDGRGVGAAVPPLATANFEYDLAPLAWGRNPFEGRLRLCEREDRVDFRAKLARVHQRGQLQQLLVVGFDNEVGRALPRLRS